MISNDMKLDIINELSSELELLNEYLGHSRSSDDEMTDTERDILSKSYRFYSTAISFTISILNDIINSDDYQELMNSYLDKAKSSHTDYYEENFDLEDLDEISNHSKAITYYRAYELLNSSL